MVGGEEEKKDSKDEVLRRGKWRYWELPRREVSVAPPMLFLNERKGWLGERIERRVGGGVNEKKIAETIISGGFSVL